MAFLPVFGATLAIIAVVTGLLFRFNRCVHYVWSALMALCLSVRTERYRVLRPSSDWRSTFQPSTLMIPTLSCLFLLGSHAIALTAQISGQLRQTFDNRAAQAAVISLPLLLISSTRKNVLACIAGVSHLDVSFLHICLGYVIAIESVVHVALHVPHHKTGWFAYLAFVNLILLILLTALPLNIRAINVPSQIRTLFKLSRPVKDVRASPHASRWWRPLHAGLGFMFLVLAGLHVSGSLRYLVIAATAVAILDNLLNNLQQWRMRIPGAILQWAECSIESHRNCKVVCENKDPENVDLSYDLVKLTVPAISLSPGCFFYLHGRWRSHSGPLQLLWYEEENGSDIIEAHYLKPSDSSTGRDLRVGTATRTAESNATRKNSVFFLIRRRDADSHVNLLNCSTRLEGPYERRLALPPGSSDYVSWFFAADDGIILALSYVKYLWTKGIPIKLNLYSSNAALMTQVRIFYDAKIRGYLPLSETRWVYSPPCSKQAIHKPRELFFKIRQGFFCERDLAEARNTYPRLRVIAAGNAAFRDRLRVQCQNGSQNLQFEEI